MLYRGLTPTLLKAKTREKSLFVLVQDTGSVRATVQREQYSAGGKFFEKKNFMTGLN